MRERMHFLVSDGSQRRDDHVEAVEPGPALNVMIAGSTNRHDEQKKRANGSEIAEGFHGSMGDVSRSWRGRRPADRRSATDNGFPTTDYKTKRPSAQCRGPRNYTRTTLPESALPRSPVRGCVFGRTRNTRTGRSRAR